MGIFLQRSKKLFIFSIFILFAGGVQAQDSDFEAFKGQFQKDYFSVGTLLQVVGDYQFERLSGENGFSVANARFQVYGEFDQKFGYQLQANFLNIPSLLDANMYYNVTPGFSVKAGLFKSPFSFELLTSASSIDFVNRSRVVGELAPSRQLGVQVGGQLAGGKLRYRAGAFNGNGLGINQNDDEQFLFVGRVETHFDVPEQSENTVIIGLNASYEQKGRVANSGSLRATFEGEQLLLGADSRITYGPFMVAGEFIYGALTSDFGIERNPFGYYATAGYFVTPATQLLVRWDFFEGDNLTGDSESIIGGINVFPTDFSEIQLNYIYPVADDVEFSQVLLNLQINF